MGYMSEKEGYLTSQSDRVVILFKIKLNRNLFY